MNGSLLHQTGHRHNTPGAAVGTSEPTAGHGGSATIAAGGEIGNTRVEFSKQTVERTENDLE